MSKPKASGIEGLLSTSTISRGKAQNPIFLSIAGMTAAAAMSACSADYQDEEIGAAQQALVEIPSFSDPDSSQVVTNIVEEAETGGSHLTLLLQTDQFDKGDDLALVDSFDGGNTFSAVTEILGNTSAHELAPVLCLSPDCLDPIDPNIGKIFSTWITDTSYFLEVCDFDSLLISRDNCRTFGPGINQEFYLHKALFVTETDLFWSRSPFVYRSSLRDLLDGIETSVQVPCITRSMDVKNFSIWRDKAVISARGISPSLGGEDVYIATWNGTDCSDIRNANSVVTPDKAVNTSSNESAIVAPNGDLWIMTIEGGKRRVKLIRDFMGGAASSSTTVSTGIGAGGSGGAEGVGGAGGGGGFNEGGSGGTDASTSSVTSTTSTGEGGAGGEGGKDGVGGEGGLNEGGAGGQGGAGGANEGGAGGQGGAGGEGGLNVGGQGGANEGGAGGAGGETASSSVSSTTSTSASTTSSSSTGMPSEECFVRNTTGDLDVITCNSEFYHASINGPGNVFFDDKDIQFLEGQGEVKIRHPNYMDLYGPVKHRIIESGPKKMQYDWTIPQFGIGVGLTDTDVTNGPGTGNNLFEFKSNEGAQRIYTSLKTDENVRCSALTVTNMHEECVALKLKMADGSYIEEVPQGYTAILTLNQETGMIEGELHESEPDPVVDKGKEDDGGCDCRFVTGYNAKSNSYFALGALVVLAAALRRSKRLK